MSARGLIAPLVLAALVAACGALTGQPKIDKAKMEAALDADLGGEGTCVILADRKTGFELYRYGSNGVCMTPLPPCSTFKVPNSLIGLELGIVTPTTVFKWDGKPEPIKAWETDADMRKALKESMVWWYQRVAAQVGHDRYVQKLKAFGYGDRNPDGPLTTFWLGPSVGGGLTISTRQQVQFLHRFYNGSLPVKPENAAFVQSIMVDETRGQSVISGKTGSCSTQPDRSRSVGWWVGRLKTPTRDLVFAASVEGATAPPGMEVERRLKDDLAKAGLWPQATE